MSALCDIGTFGYSVLRQCCNLTSAEVRSLHILDLITTDVHNLHERHGTQLAYGHHLHARLSDSQKSIGQVD
ncbi:hypothetical protein C8T65DRAFT_636699 [Cerioporus squamosus]|nr:hypothetical protein C8T65DRAFT_636699 [Cerioporus squamosus]